MLILGIHDGNKFEDEQDDEQGIAYHDGAAVLLRDGEIIAGIEEERLNRIKHSNCFPVRAIGYCLNQAGCTLADVDIIASNRSIFHADLLAKLARIEDPTNRLPTNGRAHLAERFQRAFGVDVSKKLYFCNHHLAHAWSTYALSGFEKTLILSIDGEGDGCSGMLLTGENRRITKLKELSIAQSLGRLYEGLIRVLGYGCFDEYKVMGLAPYGDSRKFAPLFEKCYRLLPKGEYSLEPLNTWFAYFDSAGIIEGARRKGEPFTQVHKDFAATLQITLEKIVLHVLRYYREQTQHSNLCLAGGVAHNCTMNGQILYSGLFDNVFVQPAAHDAGGAIGAALSALYERNHGAHIGKLTHVSFGTDAGDNETTQNTLDCWAEFLNFQHEDDVASRTAQLLADGFVIGWVQGRSEFGPRALGNRSILADPRPAENKLRINQMIKKREEYRPFAPSVLEEKVSTYFKVPAGQEQFPFMIFVLEVKEEVRKVLGAITHVDGTARVQTVSRTANPLYWELISQFEKLTGIPMLLNTSFNNNAEPIVDSLDDAIGCFLTTGIHYLVANNFVVTKKPVEEIRTAMLRLCPQLPVFRKLVKRRKTKDLVSIFEIESAKNKNFAAAVCRISEEMFVVLQHADGGAGFGALMGLAGIVPSDHERLIDELMDLWTRRIVDVHPVRIQERPVHVLQAEGTENAMSRN
jgi:carbamoyltransferase